MFTQKLSDNLLGGRSVVIVAAEGIQMLHLSKVLARAGLKVIADVVAEDRGLHVVEAHKPDVVLLDIGALERNNPSLPARILRTHCSCLILLSHLPEEESRALVAESGAHGCILKPMSQEQILSCLYETWTRVIRA